MQNIPIPHPIAEAVIAMLRPYAPDLTPAKLESALCFKAEPNAQEQLLTRKDAAKMLSISLPTLDRMLRDGELPRRHIRGAVRIPLSSIEAITSGNSPKSQR